MSTRHITEAEIADVLASPASDGRRGHLGECVQCRLLVSRYQAFMAAPEHVPPRDLAAAEARLAAVLDEHAGVTPPPARPRLARPSNAAGWLPRWINAPAWRPAFAVAAIAVIGGGLLWIRADRTREPARVLRGVPVAGALRIAPPVTLRGGGVSLRWTAVPGADRYELRFYSPELRDLGAPSSTADTTFTLDADTLPGAAGTDTLLVSISAMHGEALIARSTPQPVILSLTRVPR